MLCWIRGKTKPDQIKNDIIVESVMIAPKVEKIVENRLNWFEDAERRLENFVGKKIDKMDSSQRNKGIERL